MNTEITITALNDLIEINNDRIVGYKTALKEVNDFELETLFSKFILTSEKCAAELRMEVVKLDGETEEGTKNTGKLHRLWMDFKAAFKENNKESILESCEFGDNIAVKTYTDTLNDNAENLDPILQKLITNQQDCIKQEYKEILQHISVEEEKK
jgi:uncharacterized protein (TIGR02284 family)